MSRVNGKLPKHYPWKKSFFERIPICLQPNKANLTRIEYYWFVFFGWFKQDVGLRIVFKIQRKSVFKALNSKIQVYKSIIQTGGKWSVTQTLCRKVNLILGSRFDLNPINKQLAWLIRLFLLQIGYLIFWNLNHKKTNIVSTSISSSSSNQPTTLKCKK